MCLKRKRRHWLGRMAAEAFTADHVRFVTLTYDDEHVDSAWSLPRSHMKDYYKVRRRKYSLKHFTVGEYGGLRGRPHWHAIQFYYGAAPMEPLEWSDRHFGWAKGNSQYEVARSLAASCSYVYDYIDKGGLALRPSPGIGRRYLLNYARMKARNGRWLCDKYGVPFKVPGANMADGTPWQYWVPFNHTYAAQMAAEFIDEWLATRLEAVPYGNLKFINYDDIEDDDETEAA